MTIDDLFDMFVEIQVLFDKIDVYNYSNSFDAITNTIDHTLKLFQIYGDQLDFSLIPKQGKYHGEHLSAILRTTHSAKDKIYGWNDVLEMAKRNLDEQGIDKEHALLGLIPITNHYTSQYTNQYTNQGK